MKAVNQKLKYVVDGESAKLYARPKSQIGAQRFIHFANCHLATIPLLKKDGIQKHLHLIKLLPAFYQGTDGSIRK